MTYVAGDRVVTDLLCKPFSMGKNLLCVHSKKHMDDDPALKSGKMKQNLNTVKAMQRLLKKGGICIWIAPAGGRDRWGPCIRSFTERSPDLRLTRGVTRGVTRGFTRVTTRGV